MASEGTSLRALVNPPESFSFEPEVWEPWKSHFKRYLTVSGQSGISDKEKKNLLLYVMGPRAENIYSKFSNRSNNFDDVIRAFDEYFHPKMNIGSLRSLFDKRVQEEEVVEKFISELQSIANKCKFGAAKNDLVRNRILNGMRDIELSNEMRQNNLTLKKMIVLVQQAEAKKLLDQVNSVPVSKPSSSSPTNSYSINDTNRKRLCSSLRMSDNIEEINILRHDKEVQTLISLAGHKCCADLFTISINDFLNDDCLLNIFCYLSLPDRIKIERVCKKWKRISLESRERVKVININQNFKTRSIKLIHIEEILQRSGNFVTNFDCSWLDYSENLAAKDTLQLINNYCKNLMYLDISWTFKGQSNYLNALDVNLVKNLKSLKVGYYDFKDQHLFSLLENAKNLEEFGLHGYGYNYQVNELLGLSEKCKTLDLASFTNFSNKMLKEVLEKCPNIQNLDISETSITTPELLFPIMNQLQSLGLTALSSFFKAGRGCFERLKCPNLQKLDLSNNSIDSEIFSILLENCPGIEDLRLSPYLPCRHWEHIKKLKNLTDLDLSYNTSVSNDDLIRLSAASVKLKKLFCNGCSRVSAVGFRKVIASLPELTYLAISSSKLTNMALIESALSSLKKRDNAVPLTISLKSDEPDNIPDAVKKLNWGNLIVHQEKSINFLKIVYGSGECQCDFEKSCHCFDYEETLMYFG